MSPEDRAQAHADAAAEQAEREADRLEAMYEERRRATTERLHGGRR